MTPEARAKAVASNKRIRKHTINMHKQRFVTSLFENFNISIAKEFATFYKQTRSLWLKAINEPTPELPPGATSEQIRQHGIAVRALERKRATCWQQMMQVMQTMMRYSLPTFKSQEVKLRPSRKAVFNIQIGPAAGPSQDEEDPDMAGHGVVVDVTPSGGTQADGGRSYGPLPSPPTSEPPGGPGAPTEP